MPWSAAEQRKGMVKYMENTSKIKKPITVARDEFISDLTSLINRSGLAPFIIEPIIKDILHDIRIMAQNQLEQDTKQYRNMLAQLAESHAELPTSVDAKEL